VGRDMRGDVVRWRGKRAGHCSYGSPAAGRRGTARTGIACRLGMDTRILPLERETLYLDARTLGGATPASRCLGPRAMGSSRWWMGLDQRILALEPTACIKVSENAVVYSWTLTGNPDCARRNWSPGSHQRFRIMDTRRRRTIHPVSGPFRRRRLPTATGERDRTVEN
jgi:hypothetical protein